MLRLTPDTAAFSTVLPMSNIPARMEMFTTAFSLNVLFVIEMVAVPSLKMPFWEFPLNVLLLMFRPAIPLAPSLKIAPPLLAVFALNVVSVMVRLAEPPAPLPLLKMPPPSPCGPIAEFSLRAQLLIVRVL